MRVPLCGTRARIGPILLSLASMLVLGWPSDGQGKKKIPTIDVTAKLVEIPSKFPPNELYDYAYVMKYKVSGGELDKQTILVAHYKPRLMRSEIKDKMKKHVKGKLKRFKVGEMHKMVLATKMRKVWKGALVDEYSATNRKTKRYFCLRVDPAGK